MSATSAVSAPCLAGLVMLALNASPAAAATPEAGARYAYAQIGAIAARSESGGLRRHGPMAAMTVGVGFRRNATWTLGAELTGSFAEYSGSTIESGTFLTWYSATRTYSMTGASGFVQVSHPLGVLRPYLRGSLGIYSLQMSVIRTELLIFPTGSLDRSRVVVGATGAAGVEAQVSKSVFIGVEGRYLPFEERYGSLSTGKVNTGGATFLATFGKAF